MGSRRWYGRPAPAFACSQCLFDDPCLIGQSIPRRSDCPGALGSTNTLLTHKHKHLHKLNKQQIDAGDLVPGDICVLEEGAAVPADIRLVSVSQLAVIETLLTVHVVFMCFWGWCVDVRGGLVVSHFVLPTVDV